MPKATKICRVCGKEYHACYTRNMTGEFRWQDVTCSPECGKVYLDAILAQDEPAPAPTVQEVPEVVEVAEAPVLAEEEVKEETVVSLEEPAHAEEKASASKRKKSEKIED